MHQQAVFFYACLKKGTSNYAKQENQDDLLAEKVSAEKKLEQYTHQLQRAVNREKYLVKGEAKKRTHILCNIGGAVLSFWPEIQYLTKVEQYQIFEELAQQANVNTTVQEAVDRYRAQQNGGK